MKKQISLPNGEKAIMISMPVNFKSGSISDSGNSFVYRVLGTYIDSTGKIRGKDGVYSAYRSIRLPFRSRYAGSFVSINEAIDFDFDGVTAKAFMINH